MKPLPESNHNHRPCRWFAQAPLGPITSRAYRLIEFSFYCMMRPTAIEIAAWRILRFTSLDYLPFLIAPYQLLSRLVPRFARIFFLGIAKAFWNHRHCRWFSLYKKEPSCINYATGFHWESNNCALRAKTICYLGQSIRLSKTPMVECSVNNHERSILRSFHLKHIQTIFTDIFYNTMLELVQCHVAVIVL